MAHRAMSGLRDQTAIVGIGYTDFSSNSGVSTTTLAVRAIQNAVADAGLSMSDIDGLATFSLGDSVSPTALAPILGLKDLNYHAHQFGGGSVSHTIVGQAMMACATGVAEYVVCYRALNSRSEFRMGGTGQGAVNTSSEMQYKVPYGWLSPAHDYAMAARQHMNAFGTTPEQLAAVAINQRFNASMNERAMMRKPLTIDEYMESRWIVDPLRLFDCCLESDGACAVVVAKAEVARHLAQPPVLLSAAAWGLGHSLTSNAWPDQTESAAAVTASRLFGMAGIGAQHIDAAELYDCFTYSVLVQLEDFGFCAKGEGGRFLESGATALSGEIPVNTHGGSLSEGYIHGLNHVCEAVAQLRGQCGPRQVEGAEFALSTGQQGVIAGESSALILRKG